MVLLTLKALILDILSILCKPAAPKQKSVASLSTADRLFIHSFCQRVATIFAAHAYYAQTKAKQ